MLTEHATVTAPSHAPSPSSVHAPISPSFNGQRLTAPAAPARWRRWLMPTVYVIFFGTLAVLTFLYRHELSELFEAPPPKVGPPRVEPVSVLGPGLVAVASGTPLEQRLRVAAATYENIEYPLLNVTGYVIARLGAGADHAESRWDFAAAEIATTYGDWINAKAAVVYAEQQAVNVKNLADANVKFKDAVYERKKGLENIGADTKETVASAKYDLEQAKLQRDKDIHDAEKVVKDAVRNRGLLERRLLEAGIDPDVVVQGKDGLVLVVADVPEAKVAQVRPGQACEAQFFSYQDATYKGRVGRLGPSVSKEKRTLRVTFELRDAASKLLPGMFADIGLGTETRKVLSVPTEAVLHAGKSDYVLKEESPGAFRVVEVKVDEPRLAPAAGQDGFAAECRSRIPVLEGLREGDRVVSTGSILLKPVMVKALTNGHNNGTTH
jgi:membrane fusion protein, heavy metal efflux system